MIKCNQCGKMNAADVVNCQSCGAPFSNAADGGTSQRMTFMEQPELPAWLESLRAGERPAVPTNSASDFSTADFIDENSLPSWMRAGRNDTRDNTGTHPPVSVRPSSLPGPTTDGNYPPPQGIPAQSLLDEQSLPSWLRQGAQSNPVSAQEKISASSLVQSDNMPDWMRSLQKSPDDAAKPFSQAPMSASSQVPPTPQIPMTPPRSSGIHSSGTSFSARDLIDPQSLPSWMVQQGGQNTTTPPMRNQASSPNMPAISPRPATPPASSGNPSALAGQAGFSARDLIDPQSLPSWMVQQGERTGQRAQPQGGEQTRQSGQPAQPPYNTRQPDPSGTPGQAGPGQTFSASSLLDVNALPPWLREGGQGGQTQGQEPSGPFANQAQPPSTSVPPSTGGNISASSFLDMNAVPEWMRQAGTQQPTGGFNAAPQYGQSMPQGPGNMQANTYAGPPKVENIRVPNRPRNEINPNENSEVAANVFASMLGVASSAPNYPALSPQPQQPGSPAQPNMGYPMNQNQPGIPASGPGNYAGAGIPGNAPQGYAPGNNYGGSYPDGMRNPYMGNAPSAGMPPASNSGMPASGQRAGDAANEQKNAKKRGLFGAILEWLTR